MHEGEPGGRAGTRVCVLLLGAGVCDYKHCVVQTQSRSISLSFPLFPPLSLCSALSASLPLSFCFSLFLSVTLPHTFSSSIYFYLSLFSKMKSLKTQKLALGFLFLPPSSLSSSLFFSFFAFPSPSLSPSTSLSVSPYATSLLNRTHAG